jgi:hypothetical protein
MKTRNLILKRTADKAFRKFIRAETPSQPEVGTALIKNSF